MWHDSFICVTWLIHVCDMTHSYVWHDSSMTTFSKISLDMTHSRVWHDSFICVTWLIHDDLFADLLRHDSFMCVTQFVHMCNMTHLYVWHDSSKRVTWLIHMWDMTHSYVWRDSSMNTFSQISLDIRALSPESRTCWIRPWYAWFCLGFSVQCVGYRV